MRLSKAAELMIGDVVMPPEREVRLWMKRAAAEKGMTTAELGIMLVSVHEGASDKRGRWLVFSGFLCDKWYGDGKQHAFTFKARPETPWTVLARPTENQS